MWEPDTLRAEPVGPGDSKDGMSGKKKKGSEKATPSIYGRRSPDTKGTRSRRCWSWTPARLQGDARRRCGGAARRLQPGGRAHRKTRPDAEPHREGTRREARRPAGLAQRQNGRGGPTVRLSLERGARLRAENGPHGPRGRSASRGYGLSAQCVRLRSEINHEWCTRHREPRNKPSPRFQS